MTIRYAKEDHVVTITIDRYEKRNALDRQHSNDLVEAWLRFRDDPDAWVAILTGVNNAFCAGGDLSAMGAIAEEVRTDGGSETLARFGDGRGGHASLKGIDIFKPIIAAVNGYCIAGGMEILGGTDLRVASTDAIFSISEPKRGLIAFGGTTSRLPRQLTWPAAMELLLLAGRVSAQRALELGLINKVVATDELMPAALEWAHEIISNAPLAVQGTKKSALLGLSAATLEDAYGIEREVFLEVFATQDATEGPRAFFEKRPPVWQGR